MKCKFIETMFSLQMLLFDEGGACLDFSRPLTEIHGALVCSGGEERTAALVRGAVREAVRADPACLPRVHLFLLLNTDLPWPDSLAQQPGLAACLGLLPAPLPLPLYCDLVPQLKLWPALFDTAPHLPPPVLHAVLVALPAPARPPLAAALLAVILQHQRRWADPATLPLVARLTKQFTAAALGAGQGAAARYQAGAAVLLLIKLALRPEPARPGQLVAGPAPAGDQAAVFPELVDTLASVYIQLVGDLSIDSWLECSEVESQVVLDQPGLQYWEDTTTPPPSTLQLLLQHLQAECEQLLDQPSSPARPGTALLLQLLRPTARLYQRSAELALDQNSWQEIVSLVQTSQEDWVLAACLEKLVQCHLEPALPALTTVSPALLVDHAPALLARLDSDPALAAGLAKLLPPVLDLLSLPSLLPLLPGPAASSALRQQDWQTRLVRALNMAGAGAGDDVTAELARLALQDCPTLLSSLLEAVLEEGGRAGPVAASLLALPPLHAALPGLLLPPLTHPHTEQDRRQNCLQLCLSLLHAPAIIDSLLEGVVKALICTDTIVTAEAQCRADNPALQLWWAGAVRQLLETGGVGRVGGRARWRVGVAAVSQLNRLPGRGGSQALTTAPIRAELLAVVKVLVPSCPALPSLLRPHCSAYFAPMAAHPIPSSSDADFATRLHSHYWSAGPGCEAGRGAELLAALPALLPGEWQLLQEAGEAELLAECMLALLCEYDPELGYQLLLSYCSSLPARSSSLPLLCLLLSARLPRPDMTELLWSCLHSTLAKLGTETGEVAALLDTLPDCPGLQVARNMLESRNTETQ